MLDHFQLIVMSFTIWLVLSWDFSLTISETLQMFSQLSASTHTWCLNSVIKLCTELRYYYMKDLGQKLSTACICIHKKKRKNLTKLNWILQDFRALAKRKRPESESQSEPVKAPPVANSDSETSESDDEVGVCQYYTSSVFFHVPCSMFRRHCSG